MIYFELFYVFFLIGAFTFGGGYAMIPMIQSQVVSRGWMSEDQVTDFIGISEATPGPFAINMATFVGSSQGGFLGSLCATIGVILPSFIIILLLATVLAKISKSKYWKGSINGVKPIVIALISSTVLFMILKVFFFEGNLNNGYQVDVSSLTLFLILIFIYYIYKIVFKKKINNILLLIIAAIFGIIMF